MATDETQRGRWPQPKGKGVTAQVQVKLFSTQSIIHLESHAMPSFLTRHELNVKGVLSGFDRVRLRGTLRQLANQ